MCAHIHPSQPNGESEHFSNDKWVNKIIRAEKIETEMDHYREGMRRKGRRMDVGMRREERRGCLIAKQRCEEKNRRRRRR